jgi:hypothetical protein
MILTLNIHDSRMPDLLVPDRIITELALAVSGYYDEFGNRRSRIVALAGRLRLFAEAVVQDLGRLDPVAPSARQVLVQNLPVETLTFLLGSRYCDTDRLSQRAWT